MSTTHRSAVLLVTGALSSTAVLLGAPVHGGVRGTWYVDADSTDPTHDGSSWCDAFTTLQDALGAAISGDTIRVANGTYTPDQGGGQTPGDRGATFQLLSGVTLEGGYAGCGAVDPDERDIAANETILSGDLTGNDTLVACTQDSPDCDSLGRLCGDDGFCIIASNNAENSFHVVTGSGTDATAVLDGFTIAQGNADGASPDNDGAGMYNNAGSPTVSNCTFSGHSAGSGGGIYNVNASNLMVTGCIFTANFATSGGGMRNVSDSNATVINCAFSANTVLFNGGSMYNTGSEPRLANCTFIGNSALVGGGIFNGESSPMVTNCAFSGNSAMDQGGGIYNFNSSNPRVTNSVLWGNVDDADGDGGGPFMDESAQIHTDSGTPVVNYSIVQGGWSGAGGVGNLDADPLFMDAAGPDDIPGTEDDDLRVRPGSPAIDAGDTMALPADVADLDDDGNTAERIPLDLDNKPRVVDDPNTPDTGVPGSAVVDMGAYEFPADCNNNGVRDDVDLANLTSLDCDGNGVPDECQIDENSAAPGGPFFCLANCDPDCNNNGIPDACDIAACDRQADPTCDDCNLNGVPDECDIAEGTSQDANGDGVPDECVRVPVSGNWSDDVWGLGGNYPDNDPDNPQGEPDLVPAVDGVDVLLDVSVSTDGLRVLSDGAASGGPAALQSGGTLRVTQSGGVGDLTIETAAGVQVASEVPFSPSRILVAHDRQIDVSAGAFRLDPGGRYEADPAGGADGCASGDVCAALSAGSVRLRGASCSEERSGAEMTLTDSMSVSVSGDFTVRGSPICSAGGSSAATRLGIIRPPKLCICGREDLLITAILAMNGAASVDNTSPAGVVLGGRFDNQLILPSLFDWTEGRTVLNGSAPQAFEAAGLDLGPTLEGFETDEDTLFDTEAHTNFSMGVVEVFAESHAVFVNHFANTAGDGPCAEALYVDRLVLEAGASITLDNARVYYRELLDEGATIVKLGCGELILTPLGAPLAGMADGGFGMAQRTVAVVPNNPLRQTALRVRFVDLPGAYSEWNGAALWVQGPVREVTETSNEVGTDPPAVLMASLGCARDCRDWTVEAMGGAIHLVHEGILPDGRYEIVAVDCAIPAPNESSAVVVSSSKFGDLTSPQAGGVWPAPDGNATVAQDVLAGIDKLLGKVQPSKPRVDIIGFDSPQQCVDLRVLIGDVLILIDGALGKPYPFAPTAVDPCASSCALP